MTRRTIFPAFTKQQQQEINDIIEHRNYLDYQCYMKLKEALGAYDDEWRREAQELIQEREQASDKFMRMVAQRE